ncbi:protein kinase-like domain, concanavalin A-like lectin/glucanase domain protein [Tanacetum coccineum]
MNNLESDDELADIPLVSPFPHSDNDSDDGEVLNEMIEYENVGMLRRERAINSFDGDDLAFQCMIGFRKFVAYFDPFLPMNIITRKAYNTIMVEGLESTRLMILTTNTPYPSRKIRHIRACTHQRPQRKEDQYAVSREDQYAVLDIWHVNILEDIKRGPYSKKTPIRQPGDGVTSYTRRRHNSSSDGVTSFMTASARTDSNADLEDSSYDGVKIVHFSLIRNVAEWLDRISLTQITTWDQLVSRFLDHFFPVGDRKKLDQFAQFLFSSLTEEEGSNRIKEYVRYQDDLWDEPSPSMNVSSISEAMQPTLRGRLKRACKQISLLETPTRENDDTSPWGNKKHKEKKEDDPNWTVRSKFEDKLANFMLENKFHTKGLGDMLVQHSKGLHEQYLIRIV